MRRVLNFLGANGFTEVETAGYYDFTAAQLRSWLDAAGLRAVSGHDPLNIKHDSATWAEEYKTTLENANTLGQKLTGLAYQQEDLTEERYKQLAERFSEAGALAKAAGLQFFYHNHDFEFENKRASDGRPLYDTLLQESDERDVKFELDLYWILAGGESPLEYLSADPSRYVGLPRQGPHLEARPDVLNPDGSVKDEVQEFEDVGPGVDRLPDIFAAGLGRPRPTSTTSSSTTCQPPLASGRPPGRVQDRARGRDLPAQRALLAPAGPAGAAPYRWPWSFQVCRCQPSKSIPSIRRLRRSNTLMPVLAWPAYHSGIRCSGPKASPNSAAPRKKCSQP